MRGSAPLWISPSDPGAATGSKPPGAPALPLAQFHAGQRSPERITCEHCGTRFAEGEGCGKFCCGGCREASMRIKRAGLGNFYKLKGKSVANPVKSIIFQKRDASWLVAAVAEAQEAVASGGSGGGAPELDLDVQGISCVGCVWLIDRIFGRQAGGLRIDVNAQLGKATMRWTPGKFDAAAFADELQKLGYPIGPWGGGKDSQAGAALRGLAFRLGVCGALAMNTMAFTLPRYLGMAADFAFANVFQIVVVLSATLSLLVGGSYFIGHALRALHARSMHMDLPISLGIIAAYTGSMAGWLGGVEGLLYFDFVSIFIFLMLLGRWVQQVAIAKNRNRLLGSGGAMKSVSRPGCAGEIAVDQIGVGDEFLIGAGEMAPLACELRGTDEAEVSLEWINGEPEARGMKPGRRVPAGAVNISRAAMHVKALERHDDSLLAKLVAEEAPRSNRNPRVEKLLRLYLGLVVAFAIAGGLAWYFGGAGAGKALQVFISVLVVSCPCALGLALPLADEIVIAKLRRLGLFVRSADLWSRLSAVRRIVFDKTGTLTLEVPELDGSTLDHLSDDETAVLSTLVADSLHPVGKSLRETLAARGQFLPTTDEVHEVIGQGVELTDAAGQRWTLGKAGWDAASDQSADCVFAADGKILAEFNFREALRPKAREELNAFRAAGTEIYVLSGDRSEKVSRLARELGLPEENCLGGLDPEEKAAWVRDGGQAQATLFVGDGANDSLAFEEAAVRATPAVDLGVLERKADFYFLGRGIGAISAAFAATAKRRSAVRAVATFAICYNLGAVGLCLAGLMNPLLAAVLMPLSSIATLVIIATRLREIA